MLSHTHCLTLSLFSVLCLAEVSCSLHSSAASTTSSCLSVVVLHRCRFSFFGVILCVHLLFVDLLSFWLSDTPSPLPAVRSPMVQCCACFQFCGWSVGLSPVHVKLCQLVLCRGLSPEWIMCIKLSSFLVWFVPTSTVLTVMLRSCCGERTSVWGVFHDHPDETLSKALTVEAIKTHYYTENRLRLHSQNFKLFSSLQKYQSELGRSVFVRDWASYKNVILKYKVFLSGLLVQVRQSKFICVALLIKRQFRAPGKLFHWCCKSCAVVAKVLIY